LKPREWKDLIDKELEGQGVEVRVKEGMKSSRNGMNEIRGMRGKRGGIR
jgi:hypothetical protein